MVVVLGGDTHTAQWQTINNGLTPTCVPSNALPSIASVNLHPHTNCCPSHTHTNGWITEGFFSDTTPGGRKKNLEEKTLGRAACLGWGIEGSYDKAPKPGSVAKGRVLLAHQWPCQWEYWGRGDCGRHRWRLYTRRNPVNNVPRVGDGQT